jgi:hypothetical protein
MSEKQRPQELNPGTPGKCAACGCPRLRQHCETSAKACTWAKCLACGCYTAVILGKLRAIPGKTQGAA